jgi:hypothetical protein
MRSTASATIARFTACTQDCIKTIAPSASRRRLILWTVERGSICTASLLLIWFILDLLVLDPLILDLLKYLMSGSVIDV